MYSFRPSSLEATLRLFGDSKIQGVPKVNGQRFGLIARPPVILSAKFLHVSER